MLPRVRKYRARAHCNFREDHLWVLQALLLLRLLHEFADALEVARLGLLQLQLHELLEVARLVPQLQVLLHESFNTLVVERVLQRLSPRADAFARGSSHVLLGLRQTTEMRCVCCST